MKKTAIWTITTKYKSNISVPMYLWVSSAQESIEIQIEFFSTELNTIVYTKSLSSIRKSLVYYRVMIAVTKILTIISTYVNVIANVPVSMPMPSIIFLTGVCF